MGNLVRNGDVTVLGWRKPSAQNGSTDVVVSGAIEGTYCHLSIILSVMMDFLSSSFRLQA